MTKFLKITLIGLIQGTLIGILFLLPLIVFRYNLPAYSYFICSFMALIIIEIYLELKKLL